MEKVLTIKKNIYSIVQKVFNSIHSVFPIASPKQTIWNAEHDFDNREDYLFLPNKYSTKNHWHTETIAFGFLVLTGIIALIVLLALYFNIHLLILATGIIAFLYFFLLVFKLWVVIKGRNYSFVDFTDEEVAQIKDEELPVYTVLIPLKYEAEVIEQIIDSMAAIDYPKDKLNMIAMVEAYDTETINAIETAKNRPDYFKMHIVHYVEPQTKPKTMNMVFDQIKGDLFVIYDAEILPDPDQMKKAYLGFKKHPEVSCFQSRLDHYNTDQNILTRLFNMEFSFYYDYFLPGLQRLGFPIPLSGHSTHFRTKVLRTIGAWDPYNVAEDCDVGIRMYRYGYRAKVLNSLSREEAASDVDSWIKQRTRWMKGFIQTSIVHMRHPLVLKNELGGWKNFWAFIITVPGTVFVNVLNLVSWMILLFWVLTGSEFIKGLYTQPILYLSVATFAAGIFIFTYLNLIGSFNRKRFHLVKYGLLTPFYWFLLAIATTRATYQVFKDPFKWEKTTHGTHLTAEKQNV